MSVALHEGARVHETVDILRESHLPQESLWPHASLPLDVDPESERESREKNQGGAVARALPTCVFLTTRLLF